MNYDIKRLLGQQDPKLLKVQQTISWQLVQSMRDDSVIDYESRRALASVLSLEILKHAEVAQYNREDGLRFHVETYVYSPDNLEKLLGEAYNLGQMAVKPRPNYYNNEIT